MAGKSHCRANDGHTKRKSSNKRSDQRGQPIFLETIFALSSVFRIFHLKGLNVIKIRLSGVDVHNLNDNLNNATAINKQNSFISITQPKL
jgi:hypothetical protein